MGEGERWEGERDVGDGGECERERVRDGRVREM